MKKSPLSRSTPLKPGTPPKRKTPLRPKWQPSLRERDPALYAALHARERSRCQLCGKRHTKRGPLNAHHQKRVAHGTYAELDVLVNLMLLYRDCHIYRVYKDVAWALEHGYLLGAEEPITSLSDFSPSPEPPHALD